MNLKEFFSINLNQVPSRREKLIFLVALLLFCFGFTKACIMTSQATLDEISEKRAELESERQAMLIPRPAVNSPKLTKEWHGRKSDLTEGIANLLQPLGYSQIRLISSRFSPLQAEGSIHFRRVNLIFSGDLLADLEYLTYLENMRVPLVTGDITVKPSAIEENDIHIELTGGLFAK